MSAEDESSPPTPPRELDELDVLLLRSSGRDGGVGTTYNTAIDTASAIETSESDHRGHRKAHTMDGSIADNKNFFGDRFRGLWGRMGRRQRPNIARSHRKNKSSISELFQDAMNSVDLEPIARDFRETASSIKHSWVEELQEMDRGIGSGFFDMTATRSFAVLPDDMVDLGREARLFAPSKRLTRVEEWVLDEGEAVEIEESKKEEAEEKPPEAPLSSIFNLLLLMGAVFAHSSNSTALHMLDGVSPPMKLFWRMSASYLILIPFASLHLKREGFPKLSFSGWTTFVSASAFLTMSTMLFYTALDYTTIGNAVIYANSQALLLIVAKVFVGEPIHCLEAIGVVVAFSGAILCSKDSERSSEEADLTNALFGDSLALCSAVFGVAYLTVAKAVRSQMSVMFFITFVMFLGSLMVLLFLVINPNEEVSFDMDPFHGIFGGFDVAHNRVFVLAYLAIVVNVVGSMGFIRAMQHFDNIVIAVGTLMEPLAASFIAFIFHAGLLPGRLGWLGNFLVVIGTLAVVYPSMGKGDGGMH